MRRSADPPIGRSIVPPNAEPSSPRFRHTASDAIVLVVTYIRCPECGQKALSIATQCPKCGYVLTQNPMQSGGERGLVECGACAKMIPSGVEECPYCGYTGRAAIWRVLAVVAVIVLVVGAGFGVWWLIGGSGGGGPAAEPPRTPPTFVPASRDTPTSAVPQRSESDTGVAAPTTPPVRTDSGMGAESVVPADSDTGRSPTPILTPPPAGEPPSPRYVRWTDNWVNLREGPGLGFGVVRILLPGVRLEVGQSLRGWWPVYEVGEMVGYVAGSELTSVQPDSAG